MSQYAFFVDAGRCVKCWACEVACKQWNGIAAGTVQRRIVVEECTGTFPNVSRRFVSTSCNHCESPACIENCPVGAISKRDEDGVVVVDKQICIGCQTCARVCPFEVPRYEAESGVMDKCDACIGCGRTPEDQPRCVATCPTKALHWGPINEMEELCSTKGGQRLEGETLPATFVAYRALEA